MVIEVMRIQMDPHRPNRVVGGEEEGLLGSRAYVEYFVDSKNMTVTAEHAKLSG